VGHLLDVLMDSEGLHDKDGAGKLARGLQWRLIDARVLTIDRDADPFECYRPAASSVELRLSESCQRESARLYQSGDGGTRPLAASPSTSSLPISGGAARQATAARHPDSGGGLLRRFHNGPISTHQLSFAFQGASVDQYPLNIHWLTVKDDLTDCCEAASQADNSCLHDQNITPCRRTIALDRRLPDRLSDSLPHLPGGRIA
jgi:hypothetical protein